MRGDEIEDRRTEQFASTKPTHMMELLKTLVSIHLPNYRNFNFRTYNNVFRCAVGRRITNVFMLRGK
jgi:hypothetical protein